MKRMRKEIPKIGRPQKQLGGSESLVVLQPVLERLTAALRELNYALPGDPHEIVEFFEWCCTRANTLACFAQSRPTRRTNRADIPGDGPMAYFAERYPAAFHATVFALATELLRIEMDERMFAKGVRFSGPSEKLSVREQNIGRKLRQQAVALAEWKRRIVESFCTQRTETME